MYAEHASSPKADAKPLFLQKTITVSLDTNRFGGAERDRTADPLLAKQVLSQLSYSPISSIAPILNQGSATSASPFFPGCAMRSQKAKHGGPGKT